MKKTLMTQLLIICQKLIYHVEDYENQKIIPEYSLDYLKQLQDIRWADKGLRKFKFELEELVNIIQVEPFFDCEFPETMNKAANFLMICNVVKENREVVIGNDIVIAYLTMLKLIIKNPNKLIMDLEAGKIIKTKKKMWNVKNIIFLICAIIGFLLFLTRIFGSS